MPISLFKKKAFFTPEEAATVVAAIREAEKVTSGEIRVYMQTKCAYVDPMDRAKEVFVELNMHKTKQENGILIYIATQHREMCLYADKGINEKVDIKVWQSAVQLMQESFAKQEYVQGLVSCVNYVGTLLQQYFPYQEGDKNELPDNIVFGK
jgi:uncharacterized membrane protein